MQLLLEGQRISVTPKQSIGKGGEADVFLLPDGRALKIYKQPDHPDYAGLPHEQQGARERLIERQEKLPAFPKGLPPRVIVPEEIATDASGRVVGYAMKFLPGTEPLLRYGERSFRQSGVSNQMVDEIFLDLHTTVSGIHATRVVIGDFNDLNVLVTGTEPYVIDADSFQFGKFFCRVFTTRFVDPLLCDPKETRPILTNPYTPHSDWYSYLIMLVRSLLYVDPYGGIYIPKKATKRIPESSRPLRRITFFHPEVRYPKPATHYSVLPDDLLEHLHQVFEKDQRGTFPRALLQGMRWTTCTQCGAEHARGICPICTHAVEIQVKETVTVRGQVVATKFFQTRGVIIFAALQNERLLWLYHENGEFKREDGTLVLRGDLDPQMRYRLSGNRTLLGKGNSLVTMQPSQQPDRLSVDTLSTLPIFDANASSRYWSTGGQLYRDGDFGPAYIGDVLSGQTLFWVGPRFGFGFYRAGNISRYFVFDAERPGVNDTVQIPPLRGQLVDSTCFFTDTRCWFLVATQESGKIVHQCYIVRPDGRIEAQAEAELNDGSWLGTLRGKTAFRNFLLVATDDGVVRVDSNNGQIVVTRQFPDTEPFVNADSYLFLGDQTDLVVVDPKEIRRLQIS